MSPGEKEQWTKRRKGDALCDTEFLTESEHIQEETKRDDDDDGLKPFPMISQPAKKAKHPTTAKGFTRQTEKNQSNLSKLNKLQVKNKGKAQGKKND